VRVAIVTDIHGNREAFEAVVRDLRQTSPDLILHGGEEAARDRKAFNVEIEREDDGRWIAEVVDLPGAMAYGQTREEAVSRAEALALRILADRLENGESLPTLENVFSVPA